MEYKNRKSIRLKWYDYTNSGAYFITICTKDRVHYFGEIENWKIILNDLWKNVRDCWEQIPQHYPFVYLHNFVCMPNHIHGILVIHNNRQNNNFTLQQPNEQKQPKSWSLSAIIRGFKIGVTNFAKQNDLTFARQPRFHDHIIRNEWEYEKIKYYIDINPENRSDDCYV